METMLLRRFATPRFGAALCPCSARLLSTAPPSTAPRSTHQSRPLSYSQPQSAAAFTSKITTTATTTTVTATARTITPPAPVAPVTSATSATSIKPASSAPHHRPRRPLIALGIETSCDDTCAAIVTSDRRILSEVLRTQHHLHEPMGGIVPKLAHHAHMRNLPAVVQEAIQAAGLGERGIQEIDVVAVTRGPGLAHCLGVGLNAAKTLAAALNKPLIGVHHMEAHALTARLTTTNPDLSDGDNMGSDPYPLFPFLTLLVSGGHTLLLVAHSVDRYTTLATTVDDSIGEAFDKTARELDIAWLPGRAGGPGASLEEFAKGATHPERYLDQLPVPMSLRTNKREMKFSFAGLKSAVTRIVNHEKAVSLSGSMDQEKRKDLAAGFQRCAVTHLCQKVEQGLIDCRKQGLQISSLVISGGVGRNATLRSKMDEVCQKFDYDDSKPTRQSPTGEASGGLAKPGSKAGISSESKESEKATAGSLSSSRRTVQVICPPPKLCTDNAVMIAWTGLERYQKGLVDPYDIDIVPKWPLDMLGTGIVPE